MDGLEAYRFNVPLKRPLKLRGTAYTFRQGILIRREERWAEASPLPGFSPDTTDHVISALRGERPATVSLQFALSALNVPISEPVRVPYNLLLLGERREILQRAQQVLDSGCSAIKLKLGVNKLVDDIQLVLDVREALPDSVSLRLDANRAWTFEQAVEFGAAIADLDYEYIEEPLQNPERLEELRRQTGMRYSLDESLPGLKSLDSFPGAEALILKPTIIGGMEKLDRWVATGKKLVFSAAFESGVGVSRIIQLAAKYSPGVPAGLDTLDWLADDLLTIPLRKHNGTFAVTTEPRVDLSKLERVAL